MAEPLRLDFGVGSDPGRYGPDGGAQRWNCFAEPIKGGSKEPAALVASDGFDLWSTITDGGGIRGWVETGGYLYVMSGQSLVKLNITGTVVATIGALPGTSRVGMAVNAAATPQIAITVDGSNYIVSSDTLVAHPDADLPASTSVAFLNQRIIWGIYDGRFFWSAVDDATDVNSLDYVTAEGDPDEQVAVVAHLQEIWVFGKRSIEVWRDTGNADAPFRRNEAGVIPKGCIGKDTIAQIDNHLFWVGEDGVVYQSMGYAFKPISTFGINHLIAKLADKSTLTASSYQFGGHRFYVLSCASWTWAYNLSTEQWDPRFSYGLDRWIGGLCIDYQGMVLVADYSTNKIYKMSRTAYDEAGTTMVWRARTNPMHAFPQTMTVDRLYLDFVTGVGLNSTSAHESNPQVGLRWSDDGGYSWSYQRTRTLGELGKRLTTVTFTGLGTTRARTGRIWEIEVSSPVVRSLLSSRIEGSVNET